MFKGEDRRRAKEKERRFRRGENGKGEGWRERGVKIKKITLRTFASLLSFEWLALLRVTGLDHNQY